MALSPAHPGTILIVEDNPDVRKLVRNVLHDDGCRVVAATNRADALTALTSLRFDLILTAAVDSAAADVDHWEPLDTLRRAAVGTPTIIFTALPPATFSGYATRGFAGLLGKPCDTDLLLTTVRGVLAETTIGSTRG